MMPAAVAALALGLYRLCPGWPKFPVLLTTFALDRITGTVHGLGSLRLADLRAWHPRCLLSDR